ncbi:MAG: penicillin-binding protein 1C [Leptolyngbyaceae cyanobacterium MO_188.B28]|nr:penicillin-binding protein 1C [Leptolyngbyaceae cyanobacterium MO_188.B28]
MNEPPDKKIAHRNNFHQLWRHLQTNWGRLSPPYQKGLKAGLLLLLLGVTVRSLPYLAPIRAADLVQDQQAIEFRDRNGLPLGTLLTRDQDHTAVVRLDQISPHFIHAILAAEDQRFYRHGPLDLRAIARASLEAVQARQIVSGASTITMQLARMLDPNPRTFWGKVQEVWLSWRLAAGMSKDEILTAYINRLPMGGNVYGVEAAAKVYFGTPAADLTVAQASLLAALPNDPTDLNPYDHWDALKQRQVYVLQRMTDDGYVTAEQAKRAYTEAVTLQPRQQGIIAAAHFLFWLADQLPPDHPPKIRTTLDRSLQQFVEAQTQQVIAPLADNNVHHAAALVIDNHTAEVLAYVGSPNYFATAEAGRNDGVQALRQPGSTLKPFLYQLALENRVIRPNTILADVPTYYPIPGARLYSPVDYSETFQGPVRIRIALANSLNIPAVRVLEKVGVTAFLTRLHQLGFQHLDQSPEHYGLGLALGSGEVSLWQLANAYLTLARQGRPANLKVLLSSPSEDFGSPSPPPPSPRDATCCVSTFVLPAPLAPPSLPSPPSWSLITHMLSDRHARAASFGVDSVLNAPFPAAVKTGTSSDFRDTWTVGFTTDYTVATWVGNFNGEPMQQVSGVTGAAPLWRRIMLHLHEQQEPAPFLPPVGLVQRPICALSGRHPTPACPAVVQEYFYPEDLEEYAREPDPFFQPVDANLAELSAQADHADSASQGNPLFAPASPQYRLNLPGEYNEWLSRQPHSPLAPNELRILSPREDDYFLTPSSEPDSETPGIAHRLEFKIAAPSNQSVEWRLNGETLSTQSKTSLFWAMQPGVWTLEVRSGEQRDLVRFQVQVADPQPNRRGFSVAPP